ncbi:hypothetical protein LTS02_017541, partial [Friedmanniomyces endolithicus]
DPENSNTACRQQPNSSDVGEWKVQREDAPVRISLFDLAAEVKDDIREPQQSLARVGTGTREQSRSPARFIDGAGRARWDGNKAASGVHPGVQNRKDPVTGSAPAAEAGSGHAAQTQRLRCLQEAEEAVQRALGYTKVPSPRDRAQMEEAAQQIADHAYKNASRMGDDSTDADMLPNAWQILPAVWADRWRDYRVSCVLVELNVPDEDVRSADLATHFPSDG